MPNIVSGNRTAATARASMNVSTRRPVTRGESTRAAAESWFLDRGLPMVLTMRARWQRLWPRSAPMLAAYATAEGCEFTIYVITGDRNVDVVGSPTTVEWGKLAIVAATLPLAATRIPIPLSRTDEVS